jgi:hypothetical protein
MKTRLRGLFMGDEVVVKGATGGEATGGTKPASMVAPKGQAQTEAGTGGLQLVEELAKGSGMPAHAVAGMMRANGWVTGKQLSQAEFEAAMDAYAMRPMGGARRG